MKRLRSYGDDLGDLDRTIERTASVSSHHRRFYSKASENGRSRASPVVDDDRDSSRVAGARKRVADVDAFDEREKSRGFRKHDGGGGDSFDRRKGGFDRFRGDSVSSMVSPRGGDRDRYTMVSPRVGDRDRDTMVSSRVGDRDRDRDRDRDTTPSMGMVWRDRELRERERDRERMHRSQSFCGSRREFPKGFRSERHWSRREDGGSSWRRFDSRSRKEVDEDAKSSSVVERAGSSSSKGGGAGGGGGPDSGGGCSSKESLRSPREVKDVRSPTWSRNSTRDSKDSGGEPSKETRKSESMVADSGGSGSGSGVGSGSEMEEGELQPEFNQIQAAEDQLASVQNEQRSAQKPQVDEFNTNQVFESEVADSVATDRKFVQEDAPLSGEGEVDFSVSIQGTSVKAASNVVVKEADIVSTSQHCSADKVSVSEESEPQGLEGTETAAADDGTQGRSRPESSAPISISLEGEVKVDEHDPGTADKSLPDKEKLKHDFDLEVGFGDSNKAIAEEIQKEPEPCVSFLRDKGKGVAVCSTDEASIRDNSLVERNFIACQDDSMEGPSVRGFELFSSSAGIKAECANKSVSSKSETEKLKLEPLDLSLGLPNVSVAVASHSAAAPPPSSPPRARSVQSFATSLRTGSDCFTTSISFSGSQFIHNPSCSLTHNSVDHDFEQSVKSRPLFQGVDWQALSANDSLPKEILAKQKLISNGNSNGALHFSQSSQGMSNGRVIQQQQGVPSGNDRSGSLQKQLSGKSQYQDEFRSPAQSAGSHDTRSEYGFDKRRAAGEESVSRLFRSSSQREMEQGPAGERDVVERLIYLIVSEPIQTMAWRVNEMPERVVAFLKDSVCEMVVKEDNPRKLRALQDMLRKRSDLNLETLLKSHRVQLQILVALKTGLPDFLQRADSISSSDLAEIYLNLKCRNSNCRSALPVDECDCKFCSQKDGFCSSCMCLVCSKFDTAANTCGWVGCDVCDHWCHTDCGLLKSYIRNGRSAGSQGVSEMQFYCLACDHPSEMFGFVKDVFKLCAPEWKNETFLKELEYVRRIFSGSSDYRGKALHDGAKQLITRLQSGVSTTEICKQIMAFLNEGDGKPVITLGSSVRDQFQSQPQAFENNREGDGKPVIALGSSGRDQFQPQLQAFDNRGNVQNGVTALTQEPIWSKPIPSKDHSRMENIGVTLPSIEGSGAGGGSWNTETLIGTDNKPGDELDNIVKIKLAEAQLFQKRADDARKEAEALKRIANAKNEKVEEEYVSRIAKLRLSEVEERRRLKQEELQMLERSHHEYFNMKTRMESDIKDLLRKMEATRRNLST